jgi:outer membrane protein assembly factor BamB
MTSFALIDKTDSVHPAIVPDQPLLVLAFGSDPERQVRCPVCPLRATLNINGGTNRCRQAYFTRVARTPWSCLSSATCHHCWPLYGLAREALMGVIWGESEADGPAPGTTLLDRLYFPVFTASIVLLAFVAGAVVVLAQSFPFRYLDGAYRGGVALLEARKYSSPYATDLWRPVRTEARGVTVHIPAKAYNGLTLYTSSHAQKAFLTGMDGEVVHEWQLPLRNAWDAQSLGREPRPEGYLSWDDIQLYPNGDLLALYVGFGDTPWGYGIVKMNKNSEVIWRYPGYVHHDLEVAGDGKIYALTNAIRRNKIESFDQLRPPRIDDFVVVLSPEGKELKKVSVIDALLKSPYARMLRTTSWDINDDFLHANSIDVIDRERAAKLPFASEGQVLMSLRDIDALAVLDLEKEEVVWALQGSWHRQHDADLLPNGHILLFDNFGHYGSGGMSRVIELDPVTQEIVWSYTGDAEHVFQSDIRSGQQRLPNGNTLITESDGGRIFEVTAQGEVVWEYVNPVRGGDAGDLIAVVSRPHRVAPGSLDPGFLERAPFGWAQAARD